jgi:hypothetical protein
MSAEETPKNTVADLIAYLQTLPAESEIEVLSAYCDETGPGAEYEPVRLGINTYFYKDIKGKPLLQFGAES